MTIARKILAAALVATTVAVASVGSASAAPPHPHHPHHGAWGWGAGGLVTGMIIGSAMASSRAYEDPEPRCVYVERVNRWGEVVTRRVCRW